MGRISGLFVLLAALSHLCLALRTGGCSSPPTFYAGTQFTVNIKSGGLARSFLINFPTTYGTNSRGSPLIVAFHGSSRTSEFMEVQSQFSNSTMNNQYVVVYPQGYGDHWQGSPYANKSTNDIQFIGDVLDYVSGKFCLDSSRFFASGHSNGGGFVNTIACWPGLSGRFTAFAPMSFAVYTGSQGPGGVCQPDHIVTPVLEMHGKGDMVVPYGGGPAQGSTVPPVLTTMKDWVIRNGCSGGYLKNTTLIPDRVQYYSNDACKVQQYTFQYMGHYWPCNTSYVPQGDFKTPIGATQVITRWFSSF